MASAESGGHEAWIYRAIGLFSGHCHAEKQDERAAIVCRDVKS